MLLGGNHHFCVISTTLRIIYLAWPFDPDTVSQFSNLCIPYQCHTVEKVLPSIESVTLISKGVHNRDPGLLKNI